MHNLIITITDPDRPMIQAEALCTLSALAWTLPQSCVDICRGCLDLVVAAMEHHSSVSEWSPSILLFLIPSKSELSFNTLTSLACQGT